MSEYTKEQEAAAVEFMAREFSDWKAAVIVTAMAKRTAEAEAIARRCDGHSAREAALEAERDAFKARVAELEDRLRTVTGERDEAVNTLNARTPASPPVSDAAQPVVVTREMVEALLADAETRAVYGRGDVPLNPAARLVVAMNAVLGRTP